MKNLTLVFFFISINIIQIIMECILDTLYPLVTELLKVTFLVALVPRAFSMIIKFSNSNHLQWVQCVES